MQELKNVKNTDAREQEKDSNSQNVNFYEIQIQKPTNFGRFFVVFHNNFYAWDFGKKFAKNPLLLFALDKYYKIVTILQRLDITG